MATLVNKQVSTAAEINEAIKEGYKYAVQMSDPDDIWVSEKLTDEDLTEIYAEYGDNYIPNLEPKLREHMGCPINEAIEWFELD
jgi:hypothetical protein